MEATDWRPDGDTSTIRSCGWSRSASSPMARAIHEGRAARAEVNVRIRPLGRGEERVLDRDFRAPQLELAGATRIQIDLTCRVRRSALAELAPWGATISPRCAVSACTTFSGEGANRPHRNPVRYQEPEEEIVGSRSDSSRVLIVCSGGHGSRSGTCRPRLHQIVRMP